MDFGKDSWMERECGDTVDLYLLCGTMKEKQKATNLMTTILRETGLSSMEELKRLDLDSLTQIAGTLNSVDYPVEEWNDALHFFFGRCRELVK